MILMGISNHHTSIVKGKKFMKLNTEYFEAKIISNSLNLIKRLI